MSTYQEAVENNMFLTENPQFQQEIEPQGYGITLGPSFYKDKIYETIAQLGIELRHPGNGRYTHRYTSNGLTSAIASQLAISPGKIEFALRNMRVEAVFQTEDTEFSARFIELAEKHLRIHTEELPPSLRPPTLIALSEKWDRKSPASFYRDAYSILLQAGAVRAISGLVPWEVEPMKSRYTNRIKKDSQPSPFDVKVLEADSHTKVLELAGTIYETTGIPILDDGIAVHRIALNHGNLKIAT